VRNSAAPPPQTHLHALVPSQSIRLAVSLLQPLVDEGIVALSAPLFLYTFLSCRPLASQGLFVPEAPQFLYGAMDASGLSVPEGSVARSPPPIL